MIKIKNISNYTVYIVSPDTNTHRKLAPGREIGVTQDVYDELSFDVGFEKLVKHGSICVSGVDENVAEVIETPFVSVTPAEIHKMYKGKDYSGFTKTIQSASPATKEAMVAIAIEDRITDNAFVALIKKYCDVDVVAAIATQIQAEE